MLVKIFNANEDVLIAEISTTVDSKQTQIIDVQPSEKNPNELFVQAAQ